MPKGFAHPILFRNMTPISGHKPRTRNRHPIKAESRLLPIHPGGNGTFLAAPPKYQPIRKLPSDRQRLRIHGIFSQLHSENKDLEPPYETQGIAPTMSAVAINFDATAIWREAAPSPPTPFPWTEITQISAYKLNCYTHVDTIVTLDHESRHFLELLDGMEGFAAAVVEIGRRFRLGDDWFARVEVLTPEDETLLVWRRSDLA